MKERPHAFERLRGHRLDLVLVVLSLILVAVVVWDRGRVSTAEAERRRHEIFDAWRPDQVTEIVFEGEGRKVALSLERDDDDQRSWSLAVDGRSVPVDDQAAASLLTLLEYAAFERVVEDLAPSELGLEPPRASLRLEMPPLSYRVDVGREAPNGGAYVQVEGGARGLVRYVLSPDNLARILIDPNELRARRLAPYLSVSVEAFEVAHGETRFSLQRGGWGGRTAGAFRVKTDRTEVRADHRALDQWFAALGDLDALTFVALPPEEGDSSEATIVFRPRDEGRAVGKLTIGGSCADPGQVRVVRRGVDPIAACAPSDVVARLLVDPSELFDDHVVGTADGDIAELRLAAGPVVVDVARKEAGWHMRLPAEGTADTEAMAALLEDLVRASGERLSRQEASDLEALGLAKPVAEVRIIGLAERTGAEAMRTETIEVGARLGDAIHLRRRDDGAVLRLPYEVGRVFLPRPEALRSLSVLDLPLRAVRELSLACGPEQRLSRAQTGAWTLEEPKVSLRADIGLANDLADKLRALSALRWVSSEAEASHRLDDPWCTIEMRVLEPGVDESPRTIRLKLGAETQGGHFAQRSGLPGVFIAPRSIALSASRWLLDRTALIADPSGVKGARLTSADGARLDVRVSGDRWTADARGLGEQVRAGLADLLAEGVVSLGAPTKGQGFDPPRLRITLERSDDPIVIEIGSGEVWRDTNVFFVRRSGIDATFAVAQARVRPLLDAL